MSTLLRPIVLTVLLAFLVTATVPSPVLLGADGDAGMELARSDKAPPKPPGKPSPEPPPEEPPPPGPEPRDPPSYGGDDIFDRGLVYGVATKSNGASEAEIEEVAWLVGEKPAIELWYRSFTQELVGSEFGAIAGRGEIPYLTWEPWDWRRGTNQRTYQLRNITDGRFDAYLTRSAQTIKNHDGPVLLRFAHEMNGDWYPWSEAVNGNRPGDYVRAWQHIHTLFADAGVTNVLWVWSPNVEYPGSLRLDGLYPGDTFVDVIAVDGYNFGSSQSWSSWQEPAALFEPTFGAVRALSGDDIPLMLGEVASSELGGDKALWIDQLFTWMRAQPDLEAFVWFHLDKETDWRIDSSTTSAAAFRAGMDQLRGTG
jgi:hypothetical protein